MPLHTIKLQPNLISQIDMVQEGAMKMPQYYHESTAREVSLAVFGCHNHLFVYIFSSQN